MKYFIFLALFAATYAAPVQDDKIIGGYECRKNSVPYQVYLRRAYGFCVAALISRTWAVAPAHCTYFTDMKVHLGDHDLGIDEGTEQIIDVEKYIQHPLVNDDYWFNNYISLIKLSKPATLNNYVRTVSLPTSCPVADTKCLISGWAALSVPEGYSDRLMCVDVSILSDTSCESSHPGVISPNMFCAQSLKEHGSPCLVDFETSLVCNGQLQGLLSWSLDCRYENEPAVFTKVCKYNSWIRDIMMSE